MIPSPWRLDALTDQAIDTLSAIVADPSVPARHGPAPWSDIGPANNTVVVFRSDLRHEVLPLCVPSGTWEDRRFTLNGWLHRQD